MKKVPVGATIAYAYRFAFNDFLRILGVMWPSMLLMWIPSLVLKPQMLALATQSGRGASWSVMALFYVLSFILIFMQLIGIAQLALERRQGPVWFYFTFSKPMWRLIGSFLLVIVAAVVGYFVLVLGGLLIVGAVGMVAKAASNSALGIAAGTAIGLLIFALFLIYLYFVVRLSFLLTPVVAADEKGFAIGRSWALGKGNCWRMSVILLAVLLPFLVFEFGMLFGFLFRGVTFPPPHPTAAQTAAYQAAMNARALEMMNFMTQYWFILFPLFIAIMVVFYGSVVGAQCFAYRTLTEDETSSAVAFD